MRPSKPPAYTEKEDKFHQTVKFGPLMESQENRSETELSGDEKRFLLSFCVFAFMAFFCTTTAIILDKYDISRARDVQPSICLLTEFNDCHTVYTTELVSMTVQVCSRIDFLISIIACVTSFVLSAFNIFNGYVLVGFLFTSIFKTISILAAILLILTDNTFYYDTIYNAMAKNCGTENNCVDESTMNVVVAFIFFSVSAIITFFMTLNVLIIGSQILRKYDEAHYEMILTKYDIKTAQLFY
ncbi:unnamed protein product [Caenorhabditis nigoni]